jgi:hypothetical protein
VTASVQTAEGTFTVDLEEEEVLGDADAFEPVQASVWREAGGGLPAGFAIAIDEQNPDRMLFAARNRLYLSENGGVFWRALVPELPDILSVRFD